MNDLTPQQRTEDTLSGGYLAFLPVTAIQPNPAQPRKTFDQTELEDLARSMQANGLVQAITVEQVDDEHYYLIDGERRWRAAQLNGSPRIRCEVRPSADGANNRQRRVLALIANVQRSNLTPLEEAYAFKQLFDEGWSRNKIAHELGVSLARVTNRLALLELEPEIQDLMSAGLLPIDRRVVDALKTIHDGETRAKLARKLARPGLSIKSAVDAVSRFNEALAASRKTEGNPAMTEAARRGFRFNRPNWDALHQTGKVPAWELLERSVIANCEDCPLRDRASHVTCGPCPVVSLLVRLDRLASEAQ